MSQDKPVAPDFLSAYAFIQECRNYGLALGYKVDSEYFSINPDSNRMLGISLGLLDPETMERLQTIRIGSHLFYGPENTTDKQQLSAARENLRQDLLALPSLRDARRARVFRLVEELRTLVPSADLPADWINPIEALADQLRTNILPAQSAAQKESF